jgi:hypothetical protein
LIIVLAHNIRDALRNETDGLKKLVNINPGGNNQTLDGLSQILADSAAEIRLIKVEHSTGLIYSR